MTKKLKKFAMLVLAFVLVAGFSSVSNIKVEAASKKVAANKWYKDYTNGTSKNTYTFTMPEAGYFYYQVVPYTGGYYYNGKFQSSTTYRVYTSMTVNYKIYEDNKNASYSDGGFTSNYYCFKKGTKVKFTVYDADNYSTKYKIRVVVKKPKCFETENNNSKSKADTIKVGKTYTGLMMKDDTDWFVFKAPSTGKYKIRIVNTSDSTSCNFYTETYKGYTNINRSSIYAGQGYYTLFRGRLTKGQKIYIKSTANWYDFFYKIKVSAY